MSRLLVVGLVLVLIAYAYAAAAAPDTAATAAQFFRAGLAAYERHEYRAAALAFEEAYRRAPRGAAIYNAGRGWESVGENARAADAFASALAAGDLDEGDALYAREHLARLEPPLGVIHVNAPEGAPVALDDAPHGSGTMRLHAAPGEHEVRVQLKNGGSERRRVLVAAGGTVTLTIAEPPPPRPAPIVVPDTGPTPQTRTRRLLGWAGVGLAVVAAGVGGYTYARFSSERATFDAGADHDASLHESALHYRSATYVAWAAAAALAAGGIVLVLTSGGPEENRPVALHLGPSAAVVELGF